MNPSNRVVVRSLGPEDAESVHALRLEALARHPEAFLRHVDEERAGGPARQRDRLRDAVASDGASITFGAFVGDELTGMLALLRDADRKRRHRAQIVSVYVRPRQRGRGTAGRLLDAAIATARDMPGVELLYLSTSSSNDPALALYRSRGFEAWGVEPDFLRVDGRPVDEVHLLLRLERSSTSDAAASC